MTIDGGTCALLRLSHSKKCNSRIFKTAINQVQCTLCVVVYAFYACLRRAPSKHYILPCSSLSPPFFHDEWYSSIFSSIPIIRFVLRHIASTQSQQPSFFFAAMRKESHHHRKFVKLSEGTKWKGQPPLKFFFLDATFKEVHNDNFLCVKYVHKILYKISEVFQNRYHYDVTVK